VVAAGGLSLHGLGRVVSRAVAWQAVTWHAVTWHTVICHAVTAPVTGASGDAAP